MSAGSLNICHSRVSEYVWEYCAEMLRVGLCGFLSCTFVWGVIISGLPLLCQQWCYTTACTELDCASDSEGVCGEASCVLTPVCLCVSPSSWASPLTARLWRLICQTSEVALARSPLHFLRHVNQSTTFFFPNPAPSRSLTHPPEARLWCEKYLSRLLLSEPAVMSHLQDRRCISKEPITCRRAAATFWASLLKYLAYSSL